MAFGRDAMNGVDNDLVRMDSISFPLAFAVMASVRHTEEMIPSAPRALSRYVECPPRQMQTLPSSATLLCCHRQRCYAVFGFGTNPSQPAAVAQVLRSLRLLIIPFCCILCSAAVSLGVRRTRKPPTRRLQCILQNQACIKASPM